MLKKALLELSEEITPRHSKDSKKKKKSEISFYWKKKKMGYVHKVLHIMLK